MAKTAKDGQSQKFHMKCSLCGRHAMAHGFTDAQLGQSIVDAGFEVEARPDGSVRCTCKGCLQSIQEGYQWAARGVSPCQYVVVRYASIHHSQY